MPIARFSASRPRTGLSNIQMRHNTFGDIRGYTNPYGGGHSGGGVIGGPIGSNGNPVIHHHPH
jgi:hypothetical protein